MPRFRRKPLEIEAVQYRAGGPLPPGACTAHTCVPVHVHTSRGQVLLADGDWVFPEPGHPGRYDRVRGDALAADFEPADTPHPEVAALVAWLNHYLDAGLDLTAICEHRVPVDEAALEAAETPEFPIVVGGPPHAPAFGLLGLVSSLADRHGMRVAAHYAAPDGPITRFEAVPAAAAG